MIVSKSKIKADWKLTVLDANWAPIALYQFPDNFLNCFFEGVNGQDCQPMGDWDESFVKIGYSDIPIDLDSETLGEIAQGTIRYWNGRWPFLRFGFPNQKNPQGADPYFASGYFDYNPITKVVTRTSGGYNDLSADPIFNPNDGSFLIFEHTEFTKPIREIGVAYETEYNTYWHLDDDNNPVYTDPKYNARADMDGINNVQVSTRALILDQYGNPTSITLLPGQLLKVERVTRLEFEIPDPVVVQIPITEPDGDGGAVQTGTREVTVTMRDPRETDSFIKNAPPGPLMSVWWPQAYSCYNSDGELIPGWDDGEWITAGWDPVQENWGSMQVHDFNIDNRWDSGDLDFSTLATKNIAKIVIHDFGAVDTPPGYNRNVLATYDFNPPISVSEGKQLLAMRFGYRMKRYMSRLPLTAQNEYDWTMPVHIPKALPGPELSDYLVDPASLTAIAHLPKLRTDLAQSYTASGSGVEQAYSAWCTELGVSSIQTLPGLPSTATYGHVATLDLGFSPLIDGVITKISINSRGSILFYRNVFNTASPIRTSVKIGPTLDNRSFIGISSNPVESVESPAFVINVSDQYETERLASGMWQKVGDTAVIFFETYTRFNFGYRCQVALKIKANGHFELVCRMESGRAANIHFLTPKEGLSGVILAESGYGGFSTVLPIYTTLVYSTESVV